MSATKNVLQNVYLNTQILSFVQERAPARVSGVFHIAHQQMMLKTIQQINKPIPEQEIISVTRSLAIRFKRVVKEQGFDPSAPGQAAACLRALDLDQKKSARMIGKEATLSLGQRIKDASHLGFVRFARVEETFFLPEITAIVDSALRTLWSEIKTSHPAMGPAAYAPAAEIRGWINDSENEAALALVDTIDTSMHLPMVPPEIGRLTGLRNLYLGVIGPKSVLPDEMRQLHNLQKLRLTGNFGEISPLIDVLPPTLESLWMYDPSIHLLPDAAFRRFASFGISLDSVILPNPSSIRMHTEIYRTLGIGLQRLTDIPFGLWFIEKVELPYIHLLHLSGVSYLILQFDTRGIEFIFRLGLGILLGIPVGLLHLLLSASIHMINLFLFYVIEPIVTLVRDLLGYSRMVHVRDLDPIER